MNRDDSTVIVQSRLRSTLGENYHSINQYIILIAGYSFSSTPVYSGGQPIGVVDACSGRFWFVKRPQRPSLYIYIYSETILTAVQLVSRSKPTIRCEQLFELGIYTQTSATMTCAFLLAQPLTVSKQSHVHNFTHKAWIKLSNIFLTLFECAVRWNHFHGPITSKRHTHERTFLARFERGFHGRNALTALQTRTRIFVGHV